MSGYWNTLTTVVFAVHLMMGCCVHHSHAHEEQGRAIPAHPCGASDEQCPDDAADHSHHEPKDCQGERCSFMRSANDAITQSLIQLCQAFADLLPDDHAISASGFFASRFILTGRLPPPVRLHLVNQVMLI